MDPEEEKSKKNQIPSPGWSKNQMLFGGSQMRRR
jgi:hypothetical protein